MKSENYKDIKEVKTDELNQIQSKITYLENTLKKLLVKEEIEIKDELEIMIDTSEEIIVSDYVKDKQEINNKTKINKQYLYKLIKDCKKGVFIVNKKGSIKETTGEIEALLGYKEEDFKNMDIKSIFPLADRIESVSRYADAFTQHMHLFYGRKKYQLSPIETIVLDKKKNTNPFQVKATILKDSNDQLMGAIFLLKDISERKKVEDEIKKEKENLVELLETSRSIEIIERLKENLEEKKSYIESIVKSSTDGIIMGDTSGFIKSVNEAFAKLLDYPPNELIGKHWAEMSPLEDKEYTTSYGDKIVIGESYIKGLLEKFNDLFSKGKTYFESYLKRRDEILVPVGFSLYWICDKEGQRIESVAIVRDLTEKKITENEVQEAKDYLENIFSTSADGIVIANPKGIITNVNEAVEKMLGYSKEELIGKYATELVPKEKEYGKKVKGSERKLFEEGRIIGEELTWMRKDGNLVNIEINSGLLKDKKGNIIGSVASVRDITERKEMEEKLFQSEKLKSLGELAGGVAHDFNNVLAAILGRAQLLKMRIEPPQGKQERRRFMFELKKGLDIIEKASLDGAETVRRIQEFSQERADDKDFTQVDINELLKHTLEFTQVRWKDEAESKGIKIRIRKEFSPLPPTTGNASQLREVFTNLINNAIDVMPQGGQIKIKTFKKDKRIYITIEDTGIGVTKAIKDRIFDPFFTTKGVQFSGLGLSVSYGIINRHRGDIKVDSVDGKGTTFTITIPIAEERFKEEVRSIPTEQRKATILVIEDDKDVRQLLSDILIMGGHEVRAVSNGKKGIELFRGKRFDLVFTDLGMPEISGWQVAEEIKRIDDKTPVALITGWQVQLKQSEMKESGVDLIINKPFQMDQILRLVQEGMEIKDRLKNI